MEGAIGKIGSTETLGEAKVVFNLGAGARLAPYGFAFDDEGAEALRCRVDAGSEAGRTGTDYDDVIELLLGLTWHSELGGEVAGGGLNESCAVAEDDDRKFRVVEPAFLKQVNGFGVLLRVEPLVGNTVAGEEVTNVVVRRGPAHADDPNALIRGFVALLPCFEQIVEYGV